MSKSKSPRQSLKQDQSQKTEKDDLGKSLDQNNIEQFTQMNGRKTMHTSKIANHMNRFKAREEHAAQGNSQSMKQPLDPQLNTTPPVARNTMDSSAKLQSALNDNSHNGAFIGMRGNFSEYAKNQSQPQAQTPQIGKKSLNKLDVRSTSNDKKSKKLKKNKKQEEEPVVEKEQKVEVPLPVVDKNRSKLLLQLGMVPKGKESQLQFVKQVTADGNEATKPAEKSQAQKDLEAKLNELNKPIVKQVSQSKTQIQPAAQSVKVEESKQVDRQSVKKNNYNSFCGPDDFDDDEDDFSRRRSVIMVDRDDMRTLSMPCDERFMLSPILDDSANQDKLQAMIDDDRDHDISFEEINVQDARNTMESNDLSENQSQNANIPKDQGQSFISPSESQTVASTNSVNTQTSGNLDFMKNQKGADQMRRKFMANLTHQKVWLTPQDKPKLYETMIIFDWDDTILCTSFINPTGTFNPKQRILPAVMEHLAILEKKAKQILELSVKYGQTWIITNAGEGWVQYSAEKFMPSVVPILSKIKIISARAQYEHLTNDYTQWKVHAFLEAQDALKDASVKNIIALGDNQLEIDAAHHLAQKFQTALIKTVKFREFPRPTELVKQLNLVISKFHDICNGSKNLTIRLEKRANE